MVVCLSGATGLVGTALVSEFADRGYEIRVLTRSTESSRKKFSFPHKAFQWNPTETEPPAEAMAGADVFIHLAGENIGAGYWTAAKKKRIYDSRILSTRHLVQALGKLDSDRRPKVLVGASASGFYGNRGDEALTETSSPGSGFLPDLVQDWEREFLEVEALNIRLVTLRTGMVLSPRGGALEKLLPIFRAGLGGPIGRGTQWVSWIHLRDLVRAILLAVENAGLSGPVNCVSPHPVTNREFSRTLGRVLGRPTLVTVPAFPLRLFLREMSHLILDSQKIQPQKLEKAEFNFLFPHIGEAMEDLLKN